MREEEMKWVREDMIFGEKREWMRGEECFHNPFFHSLARHFVLYFS